MVSALWSFHHALTANVWFAYVLPALSPFHNALTVGVYFAALRCRVNCALPGISTPMLYIGSTFSRFCMHTEDAFLCSMSYLHTYVPCFPHLHSG